MSRCSVFSTTMDLKPRHIGLHNRIVFIYCPDYVHHQERYEAKIWAQVEHSCQSIFFRTFLMMRYLDKKILISVRNSFKIMKGLVILSTNVPKI